MIGRYVTGQIILRISFVLRIIDSGHSIRGCLPDFSSSEEELRKLLGEITLHALVPTSGCKPAAAYFWFKFRAASVVHEMPGLAIPPVVSTRDRKRRATQGEPSVHHRRKRNKFEPRLSVCSGEEKMMRIYLGDYDTLQEAEDVFRVAAFYYGRLDRLKDEDILLYSAVLPKIPPQLSGEPKASWIRKRATDFLASKSKSLEALQSASPAGSWDHQPGQCHPGLQSGGEFAVDLSLQTPMSATNVSKDIAPQNLRSDDNDWGTLGSPPYSPYSYGYLSNDQLFGNTSGARPCIVVSQDQHFEEADCRQVGVSEQGVGSTEGLNSCNPCRNRDACHQQDVLQQNHGRAAPEPKNVVGVHSLIIQIHFILH